MLITNANYNEYGNIIAVIDDQETIVPNDIGNRHRAALTEWEAEGNIIEPYVEPELTPEDLRALMPDLSSRQFWLAAYSVGVTKDDVIAMCDGDPTMLIVVNESSVFVRVNPDVILLSEMMDITPDQLDSLWLWAANV